MNTAAALTASVYNCDLLKVYDQYVQSLEIIPFQKSSRLQGAARFLEVNPDLKAWMAKPTDARIAGVRRNAGVSCFLGWVFIEGHMQPDLDFFLRVRIHNVYKEWGKRFGADVARVEKVCLEQMGWSAHWTCRVSLEALCLISVWTGKPLDQLADQDFFRLIDEIYDTPTLSKYILEKIRIRILALHRVCYQLGICHRQPKQWQEGPLTIRQHFEAAPQPEIRKLFERYLQVASTTLRPGTIQSKVQSLLVFAEYLAAHHPDVKTLSQLERQKHVEPFLIWNTTRPCRGLKAGEQRSVSPVTAAGHITDLRVFFVDIAMWGWDERPKGQLFFPTDLIKQPQLLPKALAPDVDRDLMSEVSKLADPFARCALIILRGTGMRIGELLDLELDCLWDSHTHGTWVKVPLGKLNTERMVPLDPVSPPV